MSYMSDDQYEMGGNIPLYKIGDIVRLRPWSDFDEHISIPTQYWTDLMGQDLIISKIQNDSQYYLVLNGEPASCIYYNFDRRSFGWCQEFLKPAYAPVFLKDEDFEI